jgi:hypothetical protein
LFSLVAPDDPTFLRIVETQGRVAQDAALENPEPHDEETRELLGWFGGEVVRLHGEKVAA